MAEALVKAPQRPALGPLRLAHGRVGLWGSQCFRPSPTVPIESIVTQLNIDMIGRSRAEGDTNQLNKELDRPQRAVRHRLRR
jgi:hypothetical protein